MRTLTQRWRDGTHKEVAAEIKGKESRKSAERVGQLAVKRVGGEVEVVQGTLRDKEMAREATGEVVDREVECGEKRKEG